MYKTFGESDNNTIFKPCKTESTLL